MRLESQSHIQCNPDWLPDIFKFLNPFNTKLIFAHSPNHSRSKWLSDVVRNDCSVNFHLSKLSVAKFSVLYDISLVRDWKRKFKLITLGSERVLSKIMSSGLYQLKVYVDKLNASSFLLSVHTTHCFTRYADTDQHHMWTSISLQCSTYCTPQCSKRLDCHRLLYTEILFRETVGFLPCTLSVAATFSRVRNNRILP